MRSVIYMDSSFLILDQVYIFCHAWVIQSLLACICKLGVSNLSAGMIFETQGMRFGRYSRAIANMRQTKALFFIFFCFPHCCV